jgi:Alternative oxidase
MGNCGNEFLFYKSHGNYSKEDLNIQLVHTEPQNLRDRLAYNCVKYVRKGFDSATGWKYDTIDKEQILRRTIFLETVAAVPGMVAAIVRHFRSLRHMTRDGGMIHIMLDEAHNERMHLLTFVRMRNPGTLFRLSVIGSQFAFGSVFMLTYAISPKFCHRFVGYIEEEACATYTKIILAIEDAKEGTELATWRTALAPAIARSYWKLGEEGTVLQMFYAIRADEAEHRDVNHLISDVVDKTGPNPVSNTEEHLNTMLLKYVKDLMSQTADNSNSGIANNSSKSDNRGNLTQA